MRQFLLVTALCVVIAFDGYLGLTRGVPDEPIQAKQMKVLVHPKTTVSYENLKSSFVPDLKKAVKTWNDKLGFTYFVVKPRGGKVVVKSSSDPADFVEFEDPSEILGYYVGDVGKGVLCMHATEITPGLLLETTFCHELGHVLGLNHSDNKKSIMYPYVTLEVTAPNADDTTEARYYASAGEEK